MHLAPKIKKVEILKQYLFPVDETLATFARERSKKGNYPYNTVGDPRRMR